jgi:insulysin
MFLSQEFLDQMSDEDFLSKRASWITKKLEKFQNVYQEGSFLWYEIAIRRYHFSRREDEAALMVTVTKQDVLDFYQRYISPSSADRKKFSSRALCKIHLAAAEQEQKEEEAIKSLSGKPQVEVKDPQDFQRKSRLYPCLC